ncbi:MAG: DNA primase [Deltaproteobacteria bacterium]|nr:DNA primase [Deltaproteobacteria bacterium]
MRISDQVIRELRQRIDIVQLVSRTVPLKKRGRNYLGLCPFHDEKTPSFNVSPERGSYYCFGCHAGGDAIAFVQRTQGKTFPEAVRALAAEVGLEIEEQEETPAEREARQQRQMLREVNAVVLQRYRSLLQDPVGAPARRYLEQRGVDAEQIERFALGFGGGRALEVPGVSGEQLLAAGVLAESDHGPYHRFADRVVFPIRDREGHVAGFGGRIFGERDDGQSAKYINSPETALFRKSDLLYGLHEVRREISRGGALLVEGYLDVVSLARIGICRAVAPCGTALTRNQCRLLRRCASTVTLCFDGDDAGRAATRRALPLALEAGLEVRLIELPDREDPDSLARSDPQRLTELVQKAPLALEALIGGAMRQRPPTVEGRLAAVAELREPLLALPDGLERDLFIQRAAIAIGIDEPLLRKELARRGNPPREREPALSGQPAAARPVVPPEKIRLRERQIARLLLEWPGLFESPVLPELPPLVQSPALRLFLEQGIEWARQGVPLSREQARALAQQDELHKIAVEVDREPPLFDEDGAQAALRDSCSDLWERHVRAEIRGLLDDLAAETDEGRQAELVRAKMGLDAQLKQGCPWLARGDMDAS